MTREKSDQVGRKTPVLAYVTGGIGLLLTIAEIGFVAREAWAGPSGQTPYVTVAATGVRQLDQGFEVGFEARNPTDQAASNVEIEATLTTPGKKPVVNHVTLDYVPGNSTRTGGVYLPANPASGSLEWRALGYAKP